VCVCVGVCLHKIFSLCRCMSTQGLQSVSGEVSHGLLQAGLGVSL